MAGEADVDPRRRARRTLPDHRERRHLPDPGGPLTTPSSRRVALATGLTYHLLEWDAPATVETTFLLVHGFMDLAFTWHEVAATLAPHAHVIAPDLRGHGDTDWIGPGGYYHFFDYVSDLDEIVARYARKRLIVVGHSMGGTVSSYWAGTRPERLHALALLEGLGPPDQSEADVPTRVASWIGAWQKSRSGEKGVATLEEAAARLRKYDARLAEPLSLRLAEAGTKLVDGRYVWKRDPLHLTMGPYPFRSDVAAQFWRRISCPTLIVDAAQTELNLPEPERAVRRTYFANHRHVVIDQAGHMMQRHQPDELARLLLTLR